MEVNYEWLFTQDNKLPNLLFQIQHQRHQKKVWNMFKFNYKNTRTTYKLADS